MSVKKAFHRLVDELPLAETLKVDLHKEFDKVKKDKKPKAAANPTPAEVKTAVAEADVTAAPKED